MLGTSLSLYRGFTSGIPLEDLAVIVMAFFTMIAIARRKTGFKDKDANSSVSSFELRKGIQIKGIG